MELGALERRVWLRINAWFDRADFYRKRTHAVIFVTTLLLLGLTYLFVYATGGTRGPYLHVAYLPILLVAVVQGAGAALGAALVATVLLGPLMPLDVAQGIPQATDGWLFRGLFFVVIGVFVATASSALRIRNRHNTDLRQHLAKTYSRNLRVFADLVESRDEQTYGHCARVAHNSVSIGKRLGLSGHALSELYWAGLLHDLGKIGVSESILHKPGRLTGDEFEQVKKHIRLGSTILLNVSDAFSAIAQGLLSHHERWDGTGYPDRLAGEEIPLFGRIVAAADVFEAVTSHRPYRHPLPTEEAIAVIEHGRESHFDPQVVDAFMSCFRNDEIALETVPSMEADMYIDAVLQPERIGESLLAQRNVVRERRPAP